MVVACNTTILSVRVEFPLFILLGSPPLPQLLVEEHGMIPVSLLKKELNFGYSFSHMVVVEIMKVDVSL